MCKGRSSPGKSTTSRGKSDMRSGRMVSGGDNTRANRAAMRESRPRGVQAVSDRAGTQRKVDIEEGRGGENGLQFRIVGVAALGDAPGKNREFQRIAAKGIRMDGELAFPGGAHFPVHLFSLIVYGHGIDGSVFRGAQAEIKR